MLSNFFAAFGFIFKKYGQNKHFITPNIGLLTTLTGSEPCHFFYTCQHLSFLSSTIILGFEQCILVLYKVQYLWRDILCHCELLNIVSYQMQTFFENLLDSASQKNHQLLTTANWFLWTDIYTFIVVMFSRIRLPWGCLGT